VPSQRKVHRLVQHVRPYATDNKGTAQQSYSIRQWPVLLELVNTSDFWLRRDSIKGHYVKM